MKLQSQKKERKRKVEVVVISDVHLGSSKSHALELLDYLKSIKPKKIILNGDIVDFPKLGKSSWPKSHLRVLQYLVASMAKDVQLEYITGNHDEMLNQFALFRHGFFRIQNNLVQELDGKKTWIFHGNVFDVSLRASGWWARGYQLLRRLRQLGTLCGKHINGRQGASSAKSRNRAGKAAAFVHNFERTCAGAAIAKGYQYVICGHTHYPEIRTITIPADQVTYLNSGDWVENLTALEYYDGQWHLYRYHQDVLSRRKQEDLSPEGELSGQASPTHLAAMNWKRA